MVKQLLYLTFLLLILGCKDAKDQRVYKPQSSANINSLLVVMDNALWNGRVGDAVRDYIGSEVYGLPQVEPNFDLNHVPMAVFSDFVRHNRTVLKVQMSEDSGIKYYKDPYASPQKMAVIKAPNRQALVDLIQANASTLISNFKDLEFKEKQRRINKALFNTKTIEAALDIKIRFSTAYRIAKAEKDFFWIRRDTQTGSLNLLLYNLPIQDFEDNQEFSAYVIRKRDSIARQFIPGPVAGNYMTTEAAYTPFFKKRLFLNLPTLETRSLWKIEGAYMSGPFVNYAFLDKKNKRLFVAEGFVYAPSESKRDYMFELETVIRSVLIQ
ncbi:MAG: DUF4837 domain-containing protein [Flavobacteriaceae bacterium]|nr:DUF4837 domain-containing protein [Flavobacteriaceae bacterium]|tara:strand:+ start:2342 stop:3316 length:975 start_codon:yes stop_codon:yes gene_type:complete